MASTDSKRAPTVQIVQATEADIPLLLDLIRAFAEYEKLADRVTATPDRLRETLFGKHPAAEAILAHWNHECAGYAKPAWLTNTTYLSTRSSLEVGSLGCPTMTLDLLNEHRFGNGVVLCVQRQAAAVRMFLRFFRFRILAFELSERHVHELACLGTRNPLFFSRHLYRVVPKIERVLNRVTPVRD